LGLVELAAPLARSRIAPQRAINAQRRYRVDGHFRHDRKEEGGIKNLILICEKAPIGHAGDGWYFDESRPAGRRVPPCRPGFLRRTRANDIKGFERVLWSVRYIIIVPVVAVAAAAVGVVVLTTMEAIQLAGSVQRVSPAGNVGYATHMIPLGTVLQMVEGYLLAAILIIFALGLYELFIARIDVAGAAENASRTLIIQSVDDLKERLGRVVLLALVIEFFQQSLRVDYGRPIDLLYMALGIVLVGGALYLSTLRSGA
jgi:uncharacterized membrane protein YqhA